jgi:hypothetical protein
MYSLQPTIAMMLSIPFIILLSQLLAFLPVLKFPIVFTIAAGVALAGALLIRQGFKHPIPKDESIEEMIGEVSDGVPKVPEVEVPEVLIPVEIPAQTATELPAELPSDVTSASHEEFKEPIK